MPVAECAEVHGHSAEGLTHSPQNQHNLSQCCFTRDFRANDPKGACPVSESSYQNGVNDRVRELRRIPAGARGQEEIFRRDVDVEPQQVVPIETEATDGRF
jgi:hypothetical protein